MCTLIGLCIRVKLSQTLARTMKVDIHVKKGSHVSDEAVSKQLNDKERVAAAMENPSLMEVVQTCLS